MRYGAYLAGGRIADTGVYSVDFLEYVTDTWTGNQSTLPCTPVKDNDTSGSVGYWRGAAQSNYRVAGYIAGGGYTPDTRGTLFTQKLDYANRTWSFTPYAGTTCFRAFTWGTTNPGTAGYTYGGYISQASTIAAAGVDKLSYSTEIAALLSSSFSGDRGLSCGPAHNGTTAAYQMGGGLGQSGGYAATTRISKIVYSTDTCSTLGSTLAGSARDLASATQNGTTAAYCFSGRGGATQVDKMAFSNETCSLLGSGHSVDVGNGPQDGGANNNGVAIYHFGGQTSTCSNLVDKWNVASGDTRSSVSGVTGRTGSWEMNTLSNPAS